MVAMLALSLGQRWYCPWYFIHLVATHHLARQTSLDDGPHARFQYFILSALVRFPLLEPHSEALCIHPQSPTSTNTEVVLTSELCLVAA